MRKALVFISIIATVAGILAIAVKSAKKVEKEVIRTTTAATVQIPSYTYATTETETTTETTTKSTTKATTTTKKVKTTATLPADFVYDDEMGEHTIPLGRFYITGYTAEEGFPEGRDTASDVGCRPGICAMNNAQRKELGIEWGDSIYIDGLGTYQVQDCGCAYGVIDIWFRSNATAYKYTGHYYVYI